MFSDEIVQYSWDDISKRISSKNSSDVEVALSKRVCNIDDFMALISPAATPYIEDMARLSRQYTQERFGKVISMYIPMYITNSCSNHCVYCGFNHNNPMPRTILSQEEIEQECKAIRQLAPFENLLIVTGENPRDAGVEYLEKSLQTVRPYFNNLSIEVMPLKSEEYYRLTQAGLNGVVCFQETYHREHYKIYHPKGMKSNYEWRLNGYDRMGQAGVHKIGMGVLIGLEEWRTDVTFMALHLLYLRKHYWRTRYSVNFPRLRPSAGGFQPNTIMSDKELAQLIFAYRIFDHDVDISVSTRETPHFRNHITTLGATSMSAGSKTEPGGYYTHPQALEQFSVSDERSPLEVEAAIKAAGYEVVWKDWDKIFD
ncbi:MAG: 2-iminoacetate synthase ThiH [Bacteroidaceae bacterium]|nr:2-iminoacetate synthase ThiH [Bacteroidaceae bacterium]